MNWGNVIWWFFYACLAIILQARLPGIDFLLPGFIIAIQERDGVQLAWVFGLFLILQEGMGNMAFGGTLLWYSLAVVLFFLGYSLFEVESFFFIFLLCGCLGLSHLGILSLLASLQDIPLSSAKLLDESILQALLTPVLWRILYPTRRLVRHENPA